MKTVEELAREAGMNVSMWNYGAGSIAFTMGTEGVARGAIERFRDLVLREAEKAVYAVKPVETDMMPHEQFAFETAILLAGDAIRAMKDHK